MGLDEFNGHKDKNGNYHYHATKTYPYVNGGLRGVVQVQNDAITPQPRTVPVGRRQTAARRADYRLHLAVAKSLLARIHGFRRAPLRQLCGERRPTYTFEFVDGSGQKQVETYKKGAGRPPRGEGGPPRGEGRPRPPQEERDRQ